jgi:creatinine amidohydrolase
MMHSYSVFDETMADMTWMEIEQAIQRGAVALLPTGVVEEHGPHLKLGVDVYIPLAISRLTKHELEKRGIPALIAPPFYWGINTATRGFPGSFTARKETAKACVYDILTSLRGWGIKFAFVFHWHAEVGHNSAILEAVAEARRDTGLNVFSILNESDIKRFGLAGNENHICLQKNTPPLEPAGAKYVDAHAGSMETAIMTHYFPEQVNSELARTLKPTELTRHDLKGFAGPAGEVRKMIPLGYFGNPAAYDADAGRELVETHARNCAGLIEAVVKQVSEDTPI